MQQEDMDVWKRERVGYQKQYSVVDTELKETQQVRKGCSR
jgi:hypothetical protein